MSFFKQILSAIGLGGVASGAENVQQANDLRKKVQALVESWKNKELSAELKSAAKEAGKDKLEEMAQDQASDIWDETIGAEIASKGIPNSVVEPIKEKAVLKLTGIIREKLEGALEKGAAEPSQG